MLLSLKTDAKNFNLMEENKPKKKKLIRTILKYSGLGVLVLLILLIALPFIYRDEIEDLVKKEINANLTAKVNYGSFDLTILSTFPDLTVTLNNLTVDGTGEFKGVRLANIGSFEAQLNIWDVIGGSKISIEDISLSNAALDVRVLPNGKANYDITLPSEEAAPVEEDTSKFALSLQHYSFENIQLNYDDQVSNLKTVLKNLNHEGSGDLTADIIDFATKTSIDEMSFEMDGLSYLTKVKTAADVNLLMEFKGDDSKFTLKENSFTLNALKLNLDGFYAMHSGYDDMDLKLNASEISFKDLLSLIPSFYSTGYESMLAKGSVQLGGTVKGKMDSLSLPGWDFGLNVKNASIKYPAVPGSINNIAIDAKSTFKGGKNLDLMTADINKFHADFVGNIIDAVLHVKHPISDPSLEAALKAKVDLSTLGKVMPLAPGEKYAGKLNTDIKVKGRMSSIDKEDYEAFKAEGTLLLNDVIYSSPDIKEAVSISNLLFRFTPKNVALEQMNAKMGKSDFSMNGTIDNYLGYIFRDELLKGHFNFNSSNLDLDQLMGVSTTETATTTSTPTEAPSSGEAFEVPKNIDFVLNTQIAQLNYDNIPIQNIAGTVVLKEGIANLSGLTMNALGGKIGLNGTYDSRNHHEPKATFGYDLKDIEIADLTKHFLTIEKLAPIAKYTKGKISTTLNLKTSLTPDMSPVISSLTGNGDLFTNLVTVSGFEPMKKLGNELKMDKLSNQTIKDLKAKFSFADGQVKLSPTSLNLGGIPAVIAGSTSFEQKMDYTMDMKIPKSMIPTGMIQLIEQGLGKVNGMVPKLNLGSIPEVIPVKALVGGTVLKPEIKTDFKESLLKATGNLKDNLKAKGKEMLEKGKDSVKTVVNNKVKEVKEDLNAKKQAILDDAQKQADKLKSEATKGANALRAEADKQAQALIDEAGGNPLKKKAAEIAGKKLKKEADEKAQRIENEATEKANNIMQKAREKADSVK